jgi:hypothetical protein
MSNKSQAKVTTWSSRPQKPKLTAEELKYRFLSKADTKILKDHKSAWRKMLNAGCKLCPIDTVEIYNLLNKIPGIAPCSHFIDRFQLRLVIVRLVVTDMGWQELEIILDDLHDRLPKEYKVSLGKSRRDGSELFDVRLEIEADEEISKFPPRLIPIGNILLSIEDYLADCDK